MENDERLLALDEAREALREIDHRALEAALYVSMDADPIEALKTIRSFMYVRLKRDDRDQALVVACFDRVLEIISHYRSGHFFEIYDQPTTLFQKR